MVVTVNNYLGLRRLPPWLWLPFYGNLTTPSKNHVSLTNFSTKFSRNMSKFACLHISHNICHCWGLKRLFNGSRKTSQTQFWVSSAWYNNHHKNFFKKNFSTHEPLTTLLRYGFSRLGARGGEGKLSGLISRNWQMLKLWKME